MATHLFPPNILQRKQEYIIEKRQSSKSGAWKPGKLCVKKQNKNEIRTFFHMIDKKEKKVKSLCHVQLFMTSWTVAYQAPPFMGFSRQEYWSGLLFPSPGDLPDPGIEPGSPALQADTLPSEPPGKLYNTQNTFKMD